MTSVLLVEDGYLVGVAIKRALEDAGAVVIGPVANLQEGLERARNDAFDLAVLDIRIRGGTSFGVRNRTSSETESTSFGQDEAGSTSDPLLLPRSARRRLGVRSDQGVKSARR